MLVINSIFVNLLYFNCVVFVCVIFHFHKVSLVGLQSVIIVVSSCLTHLISTLYLNAENRCFGGKAKREFSLILFEPVHEISNNVAF